MSDLNPAATVSSDPTRSTNSQAFEDVIDETDSLKVVLTHNTIDIAGCIDWAKHPSAGAISTFIGTTRDNFNGQEVISLEYSCYPGMAISETKKLCLEAQEKFSSMVAPSNCCNKNHTNDETSAPAKTLDNTVKKILVIHRLGLVPVSEASIMIAVTTPHRELGLKACQFLIDQIKIKVPIWKKEILKSGEALWK